MKFTQDGAPKYVITLDGEIINITKGIQYQANIFPLLEGAKEKLFLELLKPKSHLVGIKVYSCSDLYPLKSESSL